MAKFWDAVDFILTLILLAVLWLIFLAAATPHLVAATVIIYSIGTLAVFGGLAPI